MAIIYGYVRYSRIDSFGCQKFTIMHDSIARIRRCCLGGWQFSLVNSNRHRRIFLPLEKNRTKTKIVASNNPKMAKIAQNRKFLPFQMAPKGTRKSKPAGAGARWAGVTRKAACRLASRLRLVALAHLGPVGEAFWIIQGMVSHVATICAKSLT